MTDDTTTPYVAQYPRPVGDGYDDSEPVTDAVTTLRLFAGDDLDRDDAAVLLDLWHGRHGLSDPEVAAVLARFRPPPMVESSVLETRDGHALWCARQHHLSVPCRVRLGSTDKLEVGLIGDEQTRTTPRLRIQDTAQDETIECGMVEAVGLHQLLSAALARALFPAADGTADVAGQHGSWASWRGW